jgi:two-component system, LytTR family, sensor kinase
VLSSGRYWFCQIFGWGLCAALSIYVSFNNYGIESIASDLFFTFLGILSTHLLRKYYLLPKWNQLNMEQLLGKLIPTSFLLSALLSICYLLFLNIFDFEVLRNTGPFYLSTFFSTYVFIAFWLVIYYIIHFIVNNRRLVIERLQMENDVKSLEIKNIKNNLQPHFIFNALNSIRALVDEDPQSARQSITQLSNILRSSIQVEKNETVPFRKELEIVHDYLSLEGIRYEERLQKKFVIDEQTLDLPFPPMMLQTLVENAIKHGIAAHEDGGVIEVVSKIEDDKHCIYIRNTGEYAPGSSQAETSDGFGLVSTQSRLNFIYGKDSKIAIKNLPDKIVEVKIILPLKK